MRWLTTCVLSVLGAVLLSGCSLLSPKPNAGIQVITQGITSSIFLDGKYLNKTPLIEKNILPGEYTLRIEPDDSSFVPYETSVNLRSGLLTVVTWNPSQTPETSGGVIYEMEPIQKKDAFEVSFITIPDGAIITFLDRGKEFSPIIYKEVTPGHHEYEITLPSYEIQKHTINVIPGYRMVVRAKLAKVRPVDSALTPTSGASGSATESANLTGTDATQSADLMAASPSARQQVSTASPAAALRIVSTTPTAQLRVKPTNFFHNGKEVLRVRSTSGPSGAELGFVPVGEILTYLQETENNWHKVTFNSTHGWVSGQYTEFVE